METILTPKESSNQNNKKIRVWQFLLLDIIHLIISGELILLAYKYTPYRQIGLMGISDILTIAFVLVIHIGFIAIRFISFMLLIHFGLAIEVFLG